MYFESSNNYRTMARLAARLPRKVSIYDFDDTLVSTGCRVILFKHNGNKIYLTPAQFAVYEPEFGDVFDFKEFEDVHKPELKQEYHAKALRSYAKHGEDGLIILTARGPSAEPALKSFLHKTGLMNIKVVCLNSSDPAHKSGFIKQLLLQNHEIKVLEFIDDSHKNIHAVSQLANDPELAGRKILVKQAV